MFDRLPEYPWVKLKPFKDKAATYPEGLLDLSVGSPVDPTPKVIQDALDSSSNAPGYPTTWGSVPLRQAVVDWYSRRRGVPGLTPSHALPTIGSKEFISWLPIMLGIGPGDVVVQPRIAYTAYEVGAAFAGASIISSDEPSEWPSTTKLIWLNSPANPNGAVVGVDGLKKAVDRARELGAVIVNDECYAELGWEGPAQSEGGVTVAKFTALDLALKDVDRRVRTGVQDAARKATQRQTDTLNEATRTWRTKVSFKFKVTARTGNIRYAVIAVGTKEAIQIFDWTDRGTKPHRIPKIGNTTAKVLRFATGYSARTSPIANANVGPGRASGPVVMRKAVQHPGTEAREFIAFAQLEIVEDVQTYIAQAISRL